MKKMREIYDRESKTYDLTRAVYERGRFASRERFYMRRHIQKESTILVVACGTGRHHNFLVNELKCEVIGLDLSAEMLKVARSKAKVELVVGAAEYLPFRAEIFDSILCSRALYLFEDKALFLKKTHLCLKRKEWLLVSTYSKGPWIIRLLVTLGLLTSDPHSYPYNAGDLAHMLKKAEFDRIETKCIALYTRRAPRFFSKFIQPLIEWLENRLHEGRWVMAFAQKV